MSGTVERLQAIEAVTTYSPISEPLNFSKVQIGEFFGVERLQPRRHEAAAAQAGVQVA